MEANLILAIIQRFYDTVKKDTLIGYHFRFIEDFETHIPRIADFWNLQMNGQLQDKKNLPFKLIEEHKDRGIKRAEMGRWITLFSQNLDYFEQENKIDHEQKLLFIQKVEHFREKIERIIFN